MTIETRASDFERYLTDSVDEAELEQRRKRLTTGAFLSHLDHLGRNRGKRINFAAGNTDISLVNFFENYLENPNPLQEVAMQMVPGFSYSPGYADSVDVSIDRSGYMRVVDAAQLTSLQAARKGLVTEWVVGRELDLDPVALNNYDIDSLPKQLTRDLDARATGELSVHAQFVRSRGYHNFFDYLLDAKVRIEGRVDTLFEHGMQNSDTLF